MKAKHILTSVSKGAKIVGSLIKNNGSNVLMIVGGTLVIAAVVKGVIDGQKIEEDIEQAVEKKGSELTKTEKTKVVAKRMLPAASIVIIGIGCFVGAHIMDVKECIRTAAEVETLRKGYSELSQRYSALKDAGDDIMTDEQKKQLKLKELDNRIAQHPYNNDLIYDTGTGTQLYFEPLTGRYFKASNDFIEKAVNRFNRNALYNTGVPFGTVNEWLCDCLELDPVSDWADGLGWSPARTMLSVTYEPRAIADGVYVAALVYPEEPYEDYKAAF